MAEYIEARLATAHRLESALARVLTAIARSGDLDSVLTQIGYRAAERTLFPLWLVVGDGEVVPIIQITSLR